MPVCLVCLALCLALRLCMACRLTWPRTVAGGSNCLVLYIEADSRGSVGLSGMGISHLVYFCPYSGRKRNILLEGGGR